MVNYRRGKIYKVVSPYTDYFYIGSTCKQYLCQRMGNHQDNYRAYKEGKYGYCYVNDILEFPKCQIVLLLNYPCNSKDELRAKEQEIIEQSGTLCVNNRRAHTTPEHRRQELTRLQRERRFKVKLLQELPFYSD